jgi:hypothetical protein
MKRGIVLMELMTALTVLLAAITIGAGAVIQGSNMRREADARAAAREAVGLCLERVRALRSAELPAGADVALPPEIAARLPQATCRVSVAPLPGTPELLRARVEVRWRGGAKSESGEALLRRAQP